MPRSTDPVPGRKINDICPTCTRGRLRPITRNECGGTESIGPNARKWNKNTLQRLVCDICSACFEPSHSQKGVDLKEILDGQIDKFSNPEKKPDACHLCGSEKLLREKRFRPYLDLGPNNPTETGPGEWTIYLCCPECYAVLWIEYVSEKPKPLDPEELGIITNPTK